jgi:glycerol-3-phosphate dehydrogenase
MQRNISKLQSQTYDLLVIGGGINGAAISHLAAARGLKVALLEKGDFASGTSSKSTKLVHGGIRYLENFEFDLVYESLRERKIQLETAPHLVKPLGFVIPVYQGDKRPPWMIQFGVLLYDLIAGPYRIKTHKRLNAKELLELEPGVKAEGLLGGILYYDAQMDDARLCLENVLSAAEYGADAANYVKVISLIKENGKAIGVKARDVLSAQEFDVRAKKIVCTLGPWTNGFLRLDDPQARKKVRTTKGIHIVYKGRLTNQALLIMSESDRRIFFVIPWMGNSLIGTTDTDYIGSPDRVEANADDVDYLFREAKRVFPKVDFDRNKIINVFAGLRPLIRKGGSPNKVSRKHLFYETPSGIFFVAGGKYTTYRAIAEECLNKITKMRSKRTFRLYGGGKIKESAEEAAKRTGLSSEAVRVLMAKYGSRYQDVLKLAEEDPKLKEQVSDEPLVIAAEIVYSIKTEMAQTVDDIVLRRLALQYMGQIPESCSKAIKEALSGSNSN